MKKSRLLGALLIYLISTTAGTVSVGPELISDPGFDDPASWDLGIGSSHTDNGQLIVINHSGFIFSEPRLIMDVGTTYAYSLTADLVNNLSGGGKVTIGGQTIWETSYDTGLFTGTVVAANIAVLVLNFFRLILDVRNSTLCRSRPYWRHHFRPLSGSSAPVCWC